MPWLDDPDPPNRNPWWLLALLGVCGGAAGALCVICFLSWWWGK